MALFSRPKLPDPGSAAGPAEAARGSGLPGRESHEPRGAAAATKPRTPLPTPAGARSRKQTLSSPIPAMLAASMLEMTDDVAEVTKVADDTPPRSSSQRGRSSSPVLPADDDGEEYVVELVPND